MTDDRMRELEAEVERLSNVVAALERQVHPTPSTPTIAGLPGPGGRSRRDLLRMAGAAAVGAGGIMAVRSLPAAAATSGNMILGQQNDANATTSLVYSVASSPQPLMKVVDATTAAGLDPASTQQSFNGPIVGLGSSGKDGVDGYAAGSTGYGVIGQSDAGYGVVGATDTGVDLAAIGTGRFQQRPLSTPGPGQPPSHTPAAERFEMVRDPAGLIWASDLTAAIWHRLSSLIPFPDPRRIYGQFANEVFGATVGPIDATKKIDASSSGVPAGALAAYAAVQSLNASAGRLTLYPDGTPNPNITNWVATVPTVLNLDYVMIPLSSAGKFLMQTNIIGNIFVDVWGFLI